MESSKDLNKFKMIIESKLAEDYEVTRSDAEINFDSIYNAWDNHKDAMNDLIRNTQAEIYDQGKPVQQFVPFFKRDLAGFIKKLQHIHNRL